MKYIKTYENNNLKDIIKDLTDIGCKIKLKQKDYILAEYPTDNKTYIIDIQYFLEPDIIKMRLIDDVNYELIEEFILDKNNYMKQIPIKIKEWEFTIDTLKYNL